MPFINFSTHNYSPIIQTNVYSVPTMFKFIENESLQILPMSLQSNQGDKMSIEINIDRNNGHKRNISFYALQDQRRE